MDEATLLDEAKLRDATRYIDQWLEFQRRTHRLPGLAVAVAHRGEIVFSQAYGAANLASGSPLTTKHLFRIASHSKIFTAAAIMQLVEAGRLRLDDPAGTWLSWLPQDAGQVGRVTLRQLLSHSAGLLRDGAGEDFWQYERGFPSAAALREQLEEAPLVLPANTQFKYSNLAFGLLGSVIEAATGVPYNRFVTERIIKPLGLTDTGPELDEQARARLATGYTRPNFELPRYPLPHVETAALSAATGFYSTAEDLCRFGAAQCFGDERLITDASKREIQHPQWPVDNSDDQYGLGMITTDIDQRRYVGHRGAFPGYKSATRIDPHEQLVVVVLLNSMDDLSNQLSKAIIRIIHYATGVTGAIAIEASARAEGQAARSELESYVGRYFSLWDVIGIARFGDQLVGIDPELDDPISDVTELRREGDSLLISKASGYGNPGEHIRAVRNDDGSIAKLYWGGSVMRPWSRFTAALDGLGSASTI